MKEKFRQFMTGRYGADQLSRFIMACGMVTLVCYMIFRGSLWYYLTLILLVWNYYRALSRNYEKRYQENLKFLSLKNQVLGLFRKNPAADKEHRIYRCPSCKQKVRVPRGKGKIAIVCPKCHKEFIRRS
ncbi:hypothetical protein AAA088_10100 [Hominifimenecus microfluidus]|uniref:Zn-finger containing protein n=1 Tax=Hominifimenecus microfluidus TaxID=2885348 RepID=A0AAE3JHH3_9FIRM|nr:hypothetical protein [Hominifimenecus microfluidus]MCC2231941.1 hypothetical protein [Hominifimenecus microfluidus]